MKLLKDAGKTFFCSGLLVVVLIGLFLFSGIFSLRYYGAEDPDGTVIQLQQALKLSQYVLLVFLFVSYEFFKKFRRAGMEEIARTTALGRKNRHFWAGCALLSAGAFVYAVFLGACVIAAFSFYQIEGARAYIIHIMANMFVNIFLIAELGMLAGLWLSRFKNRIVSYAAMILASYLVSPSLERVADQMSQSSGGKAALYNLVELCDILPLVNTGYAPNYSFGESLLPYRIALILFWCTLVILAILFAAGSRKRWKLCSLLLCGASLAVYLAPSSKVIMNSNPDNAVAHDQYYYRIQERKQKKVKADYRIQAYQMELSVGLQLDATVWMEVDSSQEEYKMTLYHGYKVTSAQGDGGRQLSFSQKGDYVTVKNTGGEAIEKIGLTYSGCSPAYYSNVQGIFLPGYFAYYPRAGFVPLYDDTTWDISECFVDSDTEFAVKVDTGQTIYANLEKKGEWYRGKCDGFTMVSGFYREKTLSNGNSVVYPYLYGIAYAMDGEYTKKEALQAWYDSLEESLDDMDRKNTMIFCVPNVNQPVNQHDGKRQIITRSKAIG